MAALKKAYPDKSIRTLSYMCSGAGLNGLGMRNNVTRMATMKHEQKGAPVFAWYFTWQSPMLEDAGAWHTAELAFCFDNTARCAQGHGQRSGGAGAGEDGWRRPGRTSRARAIRANPACRGRRSHPTRCQTMVFDATCRIVNDPEAEARKILLELTEPLDSRPALNERESRTGPRAAPSRQRAGTPGTAPRIAHARRVPGVEQRD